MINTIGLHKRDKGKEKKIGGERENTERENH